WRFESGREIMSSPLVVDGVVYFGSYNGKVYAFR
ncbi:MAG: PQQ-binding-like beta-propeller repeat protein, partial [Synergistaceae bacterium]|nr:PQQ-binding-like beta-propeller repeat protein [Synergistaceae bacterium]